MFVFKTDATIIHYQWQGSIVYEICIQHQEIIVFIYQNMIFLLKEYDHWLWTTNDQKLLLWPGHDCGRVVDLLLDWLLDDLRLVARTHLAKAKQSRLKKWINNIVLWNRQSIILMSEVKKNEPNSLFLCVFLMRFVCSWWVGIGFSWKALTAFFG